MKTFLYIKENSFMESVTASFLCVYKMTGFFN